MTTELITPETHPHHDIVGHYFGGYSLKHDRATVFFCESYDPRSGFNLRDLADATDLRNVSERAVGRTFHEAYDQGDHWRVSQSGKQISKQQCPTRCSPHETATALYAENHRLTGAALPVVCQICGRDDKGQLAECNACPPLVTLNAQLREDRGEPRHPAPPPAAGLTARNKP